MVTNPYQYTGRDYDPETGLRYYRGRYYDGGTGKFINEDPIGFAGGANFYAYAGSSPTNFIDPSGLLQGDNGKLQPKPWDFRDIIIYMLTHPTTLNYCQCWFNNGKKSIKEAIDIISHVPIVFITAHPSIGAVTTENPVTPIEINTKGSFYATGWYSVGHTADGHPIYDPGTFEAQMVILLHELAHKVGAPGITSDGKFDDPPDASEKNTRLVIEHCKDEIEYLKVLFNKK